MRMTFTMATPNAALAALAMISAAAALAQELPTLTCSVTDMITAPDIGHDLEFEAANERKLFTISDLGEVMKVEVSSDTYSATVDEFAIISRDDFRGITGWMETSLGQEMVMVSARPDGDGIFKATVVNQYTLFVNSWHLECREAEVAAAPAPIPQTESKGGLLPRN